MRLHPIEKPQSWMLRLAYGYAKRRFGKVITPMKVVYARLPGALAVSRALNKVSMSGLTLDPTLRVLVTSHVARLNGCGFCLDLGEMWALEIPGAHEKWRALADYRTDPIFTDAERAALALAEEAALAKRASDETWEAARRAFDERQLVEILWLAAMESYYNVMNGPLGIESDGLCAVPARRRNETPAEVH